MTAQPQTRPASPFFSSGPCAKRPGWSLDGLKDAALARSHRSGVGKKKLKEAIDRSHALLGAPADWRTGIVPASDTGAYEMAMWTMLGARKVDMLAWESFGDGWVTDAVKQLKLEDCRVIRAPYGEAAPFAEVDFDRDVCFTWNGTTSGVKTPNGDWIPADRKGLTICDATSAAFAMDLPWDKLDVVTWSWQKALGGEAAHGMLMLGPRAVERLESYTPPWPLPKIFRLTKGGKLIDGVFKGETINTPSMLCVEDVIDALKWAESIGGLPALMKRAQDSLAALETWAAATPWVDFLAKDKAIRSETSVCLTIVDPAIAGLPEDAQKAFAKDMSKRLEDAGVAFDVNGYRDAPAGLRIWCGATVEPSDVAALTPWLDWAFADAKSNLAQAA